MNQIEKDERELQRQLENDEIGIPEYNRQLRELQALCSYHAHEAAQRAYNEELERW